MKYRYRLIILIIAMVAFAAPSWTATAYGASYTTVLPVYASGAMDGTVKVEVAKNAGNPSYPGLASNEQQVPFNGKESVNITFSHPDVGNYDYRITEIKGSTDKVDYDTREYFIRVVVYYDDSGKVQTVVGLQESNYTEKPNKVSFNNTYRTTATTKPDPTGSSTTKPGSHIGTGDKAIIGAAYAIFLIALLIILITARKRRRSQK